MSPASILHRSFVGMGRCWSRAQGWGYRHELIWYQQLQKNGQSKCKFYFTLTQTRTLHLNNYKLVWNANKPVYFATNRATKRTSHYLRGTDIELSTRKLSLSGFEPIHHMARSIHYKVYIQVRFPHWTSFFQKLQIYYRCHNIAVVLWNDMKK